MTIAENKKAVGRNADYGRVGVPVEWCLRESLLEIRNANFQWFWCRIKTPWTLFAIDRALAFVLPLCRRKVENGVSDLDPVILFEEAGFDSHAIDICSVGTLEVDDFEVVLVFFNETVLSGKLGVVDDQVVVDVSTDGGDGVTDYHGANGLGKDHEFSHRDVTLRTVNGKVRCT